MNFEEFKNEILKRAKAANACSGEYKRALQANTFEELAEVIKDNIRFCQENNITTTELVNSCEKPEIFNLGKDNTGLFNSGNRNSGNWNSGNRNSGNWNSGNWNSGNWNSGYLNSGNRNSGNRNSGNWNSGYLNSGNWNSGNWNSGNQNIGYWNSGNQNIGYWNSGDRNSGDRNSGDRNSGDLNSGYRNSGVFCTKKRNDFVLFFNKESNMTWDNWYNHPAYRISCDLNITEWINWDIMTDEDKMKYPNAYVCEGYLKTYDYYTAWANLWDKLSSEDKETFKTLPNFDKEIFKEVTGIEIA